MATRTIHTTRELELIDACKQGNRIAQRKLYDDHVDYMMITCLRYVRNREDAKEVMLDGFCNGFKNLDKFEYRGGGSLKAWLKKIMINQCLMFLRKSNVLQYAEEPEQHNEPAVATDAISRLSIKELMETIQQLPDGYRTVFNLYVMEQLTHKEISKLLSISENTSKSQLHRAKKMLQQHILQNTKTI